jgi:hypothetical protein
MLESTLPILFPELDAGLYRSQIDFILHLLTHKGTEYTVRYLKATSESVEHLVLCLPGSLEHEKVSLGKDRDGWPRWLGSRLKSNCINQQRLSIRLALTLCSARRLLTVKTFTDLKSITSPPTWEEKISIKEILSTLGGEDRDLLQMVRTPEIGSEASVGSDQITTYKVPRLQISLKSSPNGVSYFAFPFDRAAIHFHNLFDTLSEYAEEYFKGNVDEWLDELIEPYECLVDSNRQLHVGKISLTFETGKLKPRVFAIVDSVTQSLLGDLHQDLMSILRRIPEDCTFDQDKVSSVSKKQNLRSEPFYGFADLSNASDRIPIYLYEELGNSIRPGLGTAWVNLFNRDFYISKSVIEAWKPGTPIPESVRYQCGQPMGALSSWPFMALVHHVLVWYSFGSRKRSLGKYLLLGDDIVIFDEEAYYRYLKVLNTLGLSYTHNVSKVGFEFAKRIFHNGKEITGAYTQALWASRNEPELFTLEWKNLASRGFEVGMNLHSTFRTLLKVSRKRFEWCNLIMTVPHGTEILIQDLSRFCVQIQGRSFCLLSSKGNDSGLVESVKAFRQGASLLIKQKFQEELNAAKLAVEENLKDFETQFKLHSGLSGHSAQAMQQAIQEVRDDSVTRIRFLERDLKLQYLNPTDKSLLRPNLPDVPRRIDFSQRDTHLVRRRYRALHQKALIGLLRG